MHTETPAPALIDTPREAAPETSPTPWRISPHAQDSLIFSANNASEVVCDCGRPDNTPKADAANAALIVRAVNSHDALVALAARLRTLIDNGLLRDPDWESLDLESKHRSPQQSIYDDARAALALAKG
jgi:hypothetical protein